MGQKGFDKPSVDKFENLDLGQKKPQGPQLAANNLLPSKKGSQELASIKKEQAEAELKTKQAEIASYVESSNMFSAEELESEEVKLAIASVDYSAIKSMIADKVVAEKKEIAQKEKEIEVSEKLNLESASTGFGFDIKTFISR